MVPQPFLARHPSLASSARPRVVNPDELPEFAPLAGGRILTPLEVMSATAQLGLSLTASAMVAGAFAGLFYGVLVPRNPEKLAPNQLAGLGVKMMGLSALGVSILATLFTGAMSAAPRFR